MTTTQAFFNGYLSPVYNVACIEEMAQRGTQAIFRARPIVMTHNILGQLERRDRIVLLLLDGKRTLQDVARLTQRNELEVAYILTRLLKRGFIEFLWTQNGPDTSSFPRKFGPGQTRSAN